MPGSQDSPRIGSRPELVLSLSLCPGSRPESEHLRNPSLNNTPPCSFCFCFFNLKMIVLGEENCLGEVLCFCES